MDLHCNQCLSAGQRVLYIPPRIEFLKFASFRLHVCIYIEQGAVRPQNDMCIGEAPHHPKIITELD